VTSRFANLAVVAALTLCALASAKPLHAQVTGSSLIEAQVGNFPGQDPDNRQDLYGQINLEYGFAAGRFGGRFETNRASVEFPGGAVPYEEIVQRFVDLSDDRFRLRVGNCYTILGRGLVHRSFELKGVILDQLGMRSRFGPSRDVDGVLAEADFGFGDVRLMSGSPAGGDMSPGALKSLDTPRHKGQIGGGQVTATLFREARAGVTYLRNSFGGRDQELASGFLELDPLYVLGIEDIALPFYAEYAQIDGSFGDWWKFRHGEEAPHALYMSTNLLWGPVGLSAEWKDYSQFRLGTNDPPSLVREHGFALLNRSTHILDAELSVGYQLEANVVLTDWATVTGNLSRTDGARGTRFDEHYIELNAAPNGGHPWEATAFYDGGKDEIIGITERTTVGAQGSYTFFDRFSTTIDIQRQSGERAAIPLIINGAFVIQPIRYEDIYLSVNVARADFGSFGIVWQRTSDPADPSREELGTTPLHTFAAVISARISEQHEATLTAGQRRGGIACTAGTCYEVQPFEGVELRLVSRF